jgi:hypothetical protein
LQVVSQATEEIKPPAGEILNTIGFCLLVCEIGAGTG